MPPLPGADDDKVSLWTEFAQSVRNFLLAKELGTGAYLFIDQSRDERTHAFRATTSATACKAAVHLQLERLLYRLDFVDEALA